MHSGVREHLIGRFFALTGDREKSRLHNDPGHLALLCPSYLLAQKTCYATEEIAAILYLPDHGAKNLAIQRKEEPGAQGPRFRGGPPVQ